MKVVIAKYNSNACDESEILSAIEEYFGGDAITIVSSPCGTPGCVDGKRMWLRHHLPQYARTAFFGGAKHRLAGPDITLIDDCDNNVNAFRAAGGSAILVPRWWNSGCQVHAAGGTVQHVTQIIRMLYAVSVCYG